METIELDFCISYFPQLKIIFIVLKLYRTNLICNKTIYHNKNNKFMSQNKLVKETLTLPSEVPFFNYNINFDGLRKVVQDIGIQANENSNRIARLEQSLPKKLQAIDFTKLQKTLDQSFSLGTNCQKYLEEHQSLAVKVTSKDPKQMEFIERYCKKIQKLSQIVQVLMVQSKDHGREVIKATTKSMRR